MENSFGYFVILLPDDKGRACFMIRFSQTSRYVDNLPENFEKLFHCAFDRPQNTAAVKQVQETQNKLI